MSANNIPILDPDDKDFNDKMNFELWSTQSNSDHSNDRNRPYNGQPWTDDGERGKTEVKGLTMRDIKDCIIKGFLEAGAEDDYLNKDFEKCWDYSTDPPKPTPFLLEMQAQGKYVSTKVATGNWRPQDTLNLPLDKMDPLAIAQCIGTEIEKMMGIFPNIPKDMGDNVMKDLLGPQE